MLFQWIDFVSHYLNALLEVCQHSSEFKFKICYVYSHWFLLLKAF